MPHEALKRLVNTSNYHPHHRPTGFTLLELVFVIVLLGIVSVIAVSRLGHIPKQAAIRQAGADLQVLREAFVGGSVMPGYLDDMAGLPGFSPARVRVHNLLGPTNVVTRQGVSLDVNPVQSGVAEAACFASWDAETGRGWRGPYLRGTLLQGGGAGFPLPGDARSAGDDSFATRGFFPATPNGSVPYGMVGDLCVRDPWDNPYVLQIPPDAAFVNPTEALRFRYARLVSAGPDGVVQTPCFPSGSAGVLSLADRLFYKLAGWRDGEVTARGDDIVLFLNRADVWEAVDE